MKIGLFLVDFEMFQLIQEPKFLVRFCIFPTDDKICEPETCDIKSSLISWHLLAPAATLVNLTDFNILITEEPKKTFRLLKIMRKMI